MNALVSHLKAADAWGAEVDVEPGALGSAIDLETEGTAYDAYRDGMRAGYCAEPIETGMGGSIPFVAAFSEIYPNAAVLLIGVADPTSRYHGPNESVELADITSATIAQAVALTRLGE